jgi:hypothetical protein
MQSLGGAPVAQQGGLLLAPDLQVLLQLDLRKQLCANVSNVWSHP